jgi:hypothetical protein
MTHNKKTYNLKKMKKESLNQILALVQQTSAVQNSLLRKEHIAYCLSWNEVLGTQKKVVYNAIGPDISTVLLTTNASEIIGVDTARISVKEISDYAKNHWTQIDTKPEIELYVDEYVSENPNFSHDTKEEEKIKFLNKSLFLRQKRGYWDLGHLYKWGIERLSCLELKKMGVNPHTIEIDEKNKTLNFEWAFPEEKPKLRSIKYIRGTLDQNLDIPSNIDCFYQKSLPKSEDTPKYIKTIIPLMSSKATFIIGQNYNTRIVWENNEEYKKAVKQALGIRFKFIDDKNFSTLIDNLSDESYPEFKEDKLDGTYNYGMRFHVFQKRKIFT